MERPVPLIHSLILSSRHRQCEPGGPGIPDGQGVSPSPFSPRIRPETPLERLLLLTDLQGVALAKFAETQYPDKFVIDCCFVHLEPRQLGNAY